jgi:hypothetical protein
VQPPPLQCSLKNLCSNATRSTLLTFRQNPALQTQQLNITKLFTLNTQFFLPSAFSNILPCSIHFPTLYPTSSLSGPKGRAGTACEKFKAVNFFPPFISLGSLPPPLSFPLSLSLSLPISPSLSLSPPLSPPLYFPPLSPSPLSPLLAI